MAQYLGHYQYFVWPCYALKVWSDFPWNFVICATSLRYRKKAA